MRKLFIILLVVPFISIAQELNCTVVVNAQQTGDENIQIFKTLEKQLNEFVNKTKWTNTNFKPNERIDCSMNIIITNYGNNAYEASLQVQASRPVFNSTYSTPIYNFNDKDFNFRYVEFQNMFYNPNQFESNLISVLAFHVNIILGIDADTFSKNGGEKYFEKARAIVDFSQQENFAGWKIEQGNNQNRFVLIDNIMSPTFKEYRNALYNYHREGLDIMNSDLKNGKQNIADALIALQKVNNRRPNSFLLRTFFDAKSEEIQEVFTGGPQVRISNLVTALNKMAPTHANKWRAIRF